MYGLVVSGLVEGETVVALVTVLCVAMLDAVRVLETVDALETLAFFQAFFV